LQRRRATSSLLPIALGCCGGGGWARRAFIFFKFFIELTEAGSKLSTSKESESYDTQIKPERSSKPECTRPPYTCGTKLVAGTA